MGPEGAANGVIEAGGRRDGSRGVDSAPEAIGPSASGVPDGCQATLTSEAIEAVLSGLRGSVSAADPLARVEALRRVRVVLDEAYDGAVASARVQGATWQAIGSAAGMTRQAAQGRWGAPARPPEPQGGQGAEGEEERGSIPGGKGRRVGGRIHERFRVSVPGFPGAVTVDVVREQRPGRSRRKRGG